MLYRDYCEEINYNRQNSHEVRTILGAFIGGSVGCFLGAEFHIDGSFPEYSIPIFDQFDRQEAAKSSTLLGIIGGTLAGTASAELKDRSVSRGFNKYIYKVE